MNSKAILLNERDNVATALTDLQRGETICVGLGGVSHRVILAEDIEFGHKLSLCEIAEGQEVLKYGLPIGKALADIPAGAWVHVHNCRSARFGFRRQQYGLNT